MVTHCVHRNTKGRGLCAFLLWKQDLLLPGPLWLAVVSCCHGEPLYPNRLHNASLRRPPVIRALVLKSAISCKEKISQGSAWPPDTCRSQQSGSSLPEHTLLQAYDSNKALCVSASHQFCRNTVCAVPITQTINKWYVPGFPNTSERLFFRYSYILSAYDCKWKKSNWVHGGGNLIWRRCKISWCFFLSPIRRPESGMFSLRHFGMQTKGNKAI